MGRYSSEIINWISAMLGKRIYRAIILVCLGLSLSGVDYCQRSFSFAPQANISKTPTPSVSPTPTPDDGVGPSESPTPESGESQTPTVSPSPSPTSSSTAAIIGDPFFSSLVEAGKNAKSEKPAPAAPQKDAAASSSNWLGRMYSDEEIAGQSLDSDGDGFTDKLETDYSSDPGDPTSTPNISVQSSLYARISHQDSWQIDSDGDGVSDGAEGLSKSNPRDSKSRPGYDGDKDGLSDDIEAKLGSNSQSADTDGDGLRDDFELALSSDPFNNDTDGDGILDGKEAALGSDPTVPEYDLNKSFAQRLLP